MGYILALSPIIKIHFSDSLDVVTTVVGLPSELTPVPTPVDVREGEYCFSTTTPSARTVEDVEQSAIIKAPMKTNNATATRKKRPMKPSAQRSRINSSISTPRICPTT